MDILERIRELLAALFDQLLGGTFPKAHSSQDLRASFAARMRAAISRVDMKGIKTDLAITQFALETGYGTGMIFRATNNPGSIKATVGWEGKPSFKNTRVYPTIEDGIRDWVRLISTAPRYRRAYVAAQAGAYRPFFQELELAGYEVAEDPPYAARLERVYSDMKREALV